MKRFFLTITLLVTVWSMSASDTFWLGADISGTSALEAHGVQLYNEQGEPRENTVLMREYGLNAARFRVWVNPKGGFSSKEDVLKLALRAKEQGMAIMIDFHYSDWWADPGKQNIPKAWEQMSYEEMCQALAEHTRETLQLLKDHQIDVKWVQVGNETTHGFLWPVGRAEENMQQYAGLTQAGYDAVKAVYPEAICIVHLDGGCDPVRYHFIFDGLQKYGAKWDMIGLSVYPYWDIDAGLTKDEDETLVKAIDNINALYATYQTPLMIVETGYDADRPDEGKAWMKRLIEAARTQTNGHCEGVFYWAPEAEGHYRLGAFRNHRPTAIMDAFKEAAFSNTLCASAQKKRSFWDHGLGKFLKSIDDMLDRWQEAGVDTNYIRKLKMSRMVYLGYYGYFQQHDMTFPVSVNNADIPLDMRYMPPNLSEKKYMATDMHTYQTEVELGIDWRGIALEIPIPIRNRYSMSFGLAKNGSVWGARIRYKSLKNMDGVLDDAYNQGMTQWINNEANQTNAPAVTSESTIPAGKMDLKIFYVEGYYVFNNKRFSLAAGAYGDMIQKRSAGSLFVMGNYYQSRFGANNLFNHERDIFRNWKLSFGPGYGYNWSIDGGKVCIHLSVIPMISIWNHLVHKYEDNSSPYAYAGTSSDPAVKAQQIEAERLRWSNYDAHYYDAVDNGRSRFVFNYFGRFAVSYSFDRFLLNFLLNYRQYLYRNNADTEINNREADAQVNFGMRF